MYLCGDSSTQQAGKIICLGGGAQTLLLEAKVLAGGGGTK